MDAARFLAPFALSAAAFAQGKVWTVDDDGPADFASLTLAAWAASDGDVVLFESGSYGDVLLLNKGIHVVADEGERGTATKLTIVGVPAGSSLLVRGLDVEPPGGLTAFGGSRISNSAGAVRLEDCTIRGLP